MFFSFLGIFLVLLLHFSLHNYCIILLALFSVFRFWNTVGQILEPLDASSLYALLFFPLLISISSTFSLWMSSSICIPVILLNFLFSRNSLLIFFLLFAYYLGLVYWIQCHLKSLKITEIFKKCFNLFLTLSLFAPDSFLLFWLVACLLSRFTHAWLFVTLQIVAHQAPLPMRFSRQEYWSGLPFPLPGDLPRDRTHVSYVSCIGRWVLYQ